MWLLWSLTNLVKYMTFTQTGQCHIIHLTILRRFSWPGLDFLCTKVAYNPIHFISFWKVGYHGFIARSDIQVSTKQMSLPRLLVNVQYFGEPLWPRSSVLGLRPPSSNFESCVWSAMSPLSSHHPQKVPLVQFSEYVMCTKVALKPIHSAKQLDEKFNL